MIYIRQPRYRFPLYIGRILPRLRYPNPVFLYPTQSFIRILGIFRGVL